MRACGRAGLLPGIEWVLSARAAFSLSLTDTFVEGLPQSRPDDR